MLDVKLAGAQMFENLKVFPLIAAGAGDLPWDLMMDALAAGTLTIGEVGQGTVPALASMNAGDRHVLVLDGEQLIGSRQNRMTNRSILLPAHSKTEIPVFCMEQGRWHFNSEHMQSAPQHSPSKLRRRARDVEARYAAAGFAAEPGQLSEEQGVFWHDVSGTLSDLGGDSPTSSLHATYEANARRIAAFVTAFHREDDQIGLLAFVDELVLGMDILGAPRLYAGVHDRLLRGYALDAMTVPRRDDAHMHVNDAAAQSYLDIVRTASRHDAPTVGAGTYHVLSGAVVGGELLDDERRVAHLSAFPSVQRGSDRPQLHTRLTDPVPPPSYRRRHRGSGEDR
jgi:hypothetical protein